MNTLANRAFAATEWITKFAYINLLWMGFSLAGLIVLGFFPATVAMFTIIRKWLKGETEIPIFRTFWTTWKSEFFRSNGLGLLVAAVVGLIVFNMVFVEKSVTGFTSVIQIPIYLFMFAAIMTIMYLFPVYVHFELKWFQMVKNSFLMMLISPIENIVMIAGIIAVLFVVKFIPALGFFFGGSLIAVIIMSAAYLVFGKMDRKRRVTE
ncbi:MULTISPECIES: YesL family protein [unclassified Mesobacillus]|uniref:YesL family protein n=1 Tax=unclassified Mesobacillus TaxID=2675270 RepID=UPI00203EB199|nr:MULTISPECIES: YesL family protein [unclassified Mesobacillus]MCM3123904.1 YesL family protein [Mesobacillus sp. MER 33]MCM3234081.1 YesL family protein [Mesobacillus sp. MER 48]